MYIDSYLLTLTDLLEILSAKSDSRCFVVVLFSLIHEIDYYPQVNNINSQILFWYLTNYIIGIILKNEFLSCFVERIFLENDGLYESALKRALCSLYTCRINILNWHDCGTRLPLSSSFVLETSRLCLGNDLFSVKQRQVYSPFFGPTVTAVGGE